MKIKIKTKTKCNYKKIKILKKIKFHWNKMNYNHNSQMNKINKIRRSKAMNEIY
jgi:hypothetical protein